MPTVDDEIGLVIRDKYNNIDYMGDTIFGNILVGDNHDKKVAIKSCNRELIKQWQKTQKKAVKENSSMNKCRVEDPYVEAEIMRQLGVPGHRNVIRFVEMLEDERYLYIIMEFASQGALCELIMSGVLNEGWTRNLFVQLVLAVKYCHSMNVIHGDISPENCLVEIREQKGQEEVILILADFGAASRWTVGGSDRIVGKGPYMAPEIGKVFDDPLKVLRYDGFKADVWSMGIILFLMLARGRLPFSRPREEDHGFKYLKANGIRAYLDVLGISIAEDACDLLATILVIDPALRPTPDQILEHRWFMPSPKKASVE